MNNETDNDGTPPPTTWWILSDRPEMAKNITKAVQQQSQQPTSSQEAVPSVTLRAVEGYTEAFMAHNKHSLAGQQLYRHSEIEPSIMDWMVLHDSDVALVMQGAFGQTGAYGNGKYPVARCHGFDVYQPSSN